MPLTRPKKCVFLLGNLLWQTSPHYLRQKKVDFVFWRHVEHATKIKKQFALDEKNWVRAADDDAQVKKFSFSLSRSSRTIR
jgi:hypothetical protein